MIKLNHSKIILKHNFCSFFKGGQVLRIALTLSALYGIDIKINNIRAGRPKPGLSPQHLKGILITNYHKTINKFFKNYNIAIDCSQFRRGNC